jgi:hypothetical protein
VTDLHPRIIKRLQIAVPHATSERASPVPPAPVRCKVQKSATLVEAGGRTVAIEVTCSCGETTLVELEFPATATAASSIAPMNTTVERKAAS